LDIPEDQVQVISSVIGGAFGGKEDSSMSILAALGAQATRSTVRLVNTRKESFLAHPKRHPAQIKYKLGARKDGSFSALKVEAYLDTGAYASYGPAVAMIFAETLTGSYKIPHVEIDTFVVYTNSPLSGAMRGFGSPQAHFAVESMVDMMAVDLKVDPLFLRKNNALTPGDQLFTKVEVNNTAKALPICLENADRIQKEFRKVKSSSGKKAGVGMALAIQSMGLGANIPDDSTHRITWTADGVKIDLGSPDLGQGLASVAEIITADALGLDIKDVKSGQLSTRLSPNGNVTCASRMTYMVGNALIDASEKLVKNLLSAASAIFNLPVESLSYQEGHIIKSDGTKVPAEKIATQLMLDGVVLQSESTFSFPYPEKTTPQHLPVGMPHVLFCFGAQVARVEVDPELGTVEVTHFAAIHDVGKIITQTGVEGQIEGGVATGLGSALFEDMVQKDQGWVDSFTEYLLPTAVDMPEHYQNIILEIPEASGPYGAKGIGEIPLVPTAPAVANAVFDAVNVRVTKLPMTPERILGLD
jgi:xanthine dehydrogenase molybdenum-binding subunit